MMKRTLLPATLLLALLAGACADAVTSSPGITASGDALRSSGGDSESLLLASTYSGAQQPGWKTVATLPDSAWVVIDVIGQVYHSKNPDCDALPPAWRPVNYPWDKLHAGPLFGGSQVAVRPIPGGGPYRLWPVNGDTETATHARALVYSRQPGMKLEVGRVSVMSLCGNPTAGAWFPLYTLAGGQQVTLTKIGSPLLFDAPDVIAPNQKTTFAVSPHGSLRLLNPPGVNGKPGRLTWYYAPGDTLPEPVHAATGFMYVIPGCLEEKVCEHAPDKSGRLVVSGFVEGTSVFRKSHVIRVDSARLELSCNGQDSILTIDRAETVTCTPRVAPKGGTPEILRWEFAADNSDYQNPAPGGAPFTGAEWSGRVVLSGTVTVHARVAGEPTSDAVKVQVRPRDWSGLQIPRNVTEDPAATDLPHRPDSLHMLGHIHQGMAVTLSREMWEPILSGPNMNLAYLVKPPAEYTGSIHVNRVALSVGSDFYNAQPTRQRSSGVMDCLQREADVVGFIPVILQHEGIGLDPKSHAYLYVTEAERVGNPLYERIVGNSLQDLANKSAGVLATARDSAVLASARADSAGYRPQWCRFTFRYRSR